MSWKAIAETFGIEMKECAKNLEKLEGQICLPPKKLITSY